MALEKAIIEIIDKRGTAVVLNVEARAAWENLSGGAAGLNSKAVESSTTLQGLQRQAGIANSQNKDSTKKRFVVQFNPNQLSFTAYGGNMETIVTVAKPKEEEKQGKDASGEKLGEGIDDKEKAKKAGKEEQAVKIGERPARIELSVPLIFDSVNLHDAFMFHSSSANVYGVASRVSSAIKETEGKRYSVQPQVEGFLAALRGVKTRYLNFAWGDMVYSGLMTSVAAEYTMFSREGRPIRARVDLGILLSDESIEQGYMGQWYESYKKAFLDQGTSDYGKTAQKVGNLFNIGY